MSPITAADFDIQNFSGDVCERLRKLLIVNNNLKTFFEWFLTDNGEVTSAFKALIQDIATPTGSVLWMPIDSVPAGYLECNGQTVNRVTYAALFGLIKTTFGDGDGVNSFAVPDLRGVFLFGRNGIKNPGDRGGVETVALTLTQIPAHTHDIKFTFTADAAAALPETEAGSASEDDTYPTESAGGGQPHENMPPYQTGLWLIKT